VLDVLVVASRGVVYIYGRTGEEGTVTSTQVLTSHMEAYSVEVSVVLRPFHQHASAYAYLIPYLGLG
jgi:hypothetical protein